MGGWGGKAGTGQSVKKKTKEEKCRFGEKTD